jgi:hypothetical protein
MISAFGGGIWLRAGGGVGGGACGFLAAHPLSRRQVKSNKPFISLVFAQPEAPCLWQFWLHQSILPSALDA